MSLTPEENQRYSEAWYKNGQRQGRFSWLVECSSWPRVTARGNFVPMAEWLIQNNQLPGTDWRIRKSSHWGKLGDTDVVVEWYIRDQKTHLMFALMAGGNSREGRQF
jgi:hypothetical protein